VSDASGSGPESIWAKPVRGSRGPLPGHSRDDIAAAATALADADGLAAVSMRAVATALGTGAGSLYRYVGSRDDILDLMADRAAGELRPYPDEAGDWLESMLRLAHEQRDLYRRHRWLLDLAVRTSGVGPHSLAWFDHCLHLLRPVCCPATTKFEAIAMMNGVTSLFARYEAASPSISLVGVDLAAYPDLAAAYAQPVTGPPAGDLFERTLRSLLTGLLTAGPAAGR
jgi:AcrR family transcriptional regulator